MIRERIIRKDATESIQDSLAESNAQAAEAGLSGYAPDNNAADSLQIAENNVRAAEALAGAENSKVKRTGVKWTIRTVGAIVLATVVTAGALDKLDDIADKFKSGIVHEDTQISPENALEEITLPDMAILVQGKGTGATQVQARPSSDIPLFGAIYNGTLAKLQDKSTVVRRRGAVQVGTKRGAITLQPYDIPKTAGSEEKKYGARAEVNVGRLFSQVVAIADRDKNGEPKVDVDDDFLASESTEDGAKRGVTVSDVAEDGLRDSCSEVLKYALPAGVIDHVSNELQNAIDLVKAVDDPKKQSAATVLEEMTKHRIDVTFVETYTTQTGSLSTRPVKVDAVRFSDDIKSPQKSLAKTFNTTPENIIVSQKGSSCALKGKAPKQFNDLLNKSNGTKPIEVGV
ncbi:MAG: hypothetical protein ACR2FM_03650 [Candidatus Saccharimonadales bacterium]